jgi:ADP-dependent NAD(P)H-hydrate dehydratase / NAD(P)H-hydrate epimerase
MRAAEEAAFASGILAEDLMEDAGAAVAHRAGRLAGGPGVCHVFYGKGNNGGDALVAARLLASRGWEICEHPATEDPGPLARKKLSAMRGFLSNVPPPARIPGARPAIVIDGLLGTGARGAPRGATAERIREINTLRARGARILAIDLPSGLEPDQGTPFADCVHADWTVALGAVKAGLVADSATGHVGRIETIPLRGVSCAGDRKWRVASPDWLQILLPPRPYESHKGNCGRISIVAGSPGFLGAARLASAAAVRAGAGLVTLFADPSCAEILAASCVPEVMVQPVSDLRCVPDHPADALAIGPGFGRARDTHALALIRDFKGPVVVDADALNALAADPALLRHARGPRILTPHPGEMERLDPARGRSRRDWASQFSAQFQCLTLLKGARSVFARPDGTGVFNSTGGPGMATGGMGDVLTGALTALIPQTSPDSAPILAMWLCGRAAEINLELNESEHSLRASDIIESIGHAFKELHHQI